MGATAATRSFNVEAWTLFALLACWQLPHFYAIAWMYRDDYRAAGLRMVSTHDSTVAHVNPSRHFRARAAAGQPAAAIIGHSGIFYAVVAAILLARLPRHGHPLRRQPDRAHARSLFLTSIIYLPLILTALALDIPFRGVALRCSGGL